MVNDTFIPSTVTQTTSMVFTPESVYYAAVFSLFLLLFMLIPYLVELFSAYRLARKRDEKAMELLKSSISEFLATLKNQNCSLTDEQLEKFYDRVFAPVQNIMKQPVTGVPGSTRGIIAFAIIFTVGISAVLVMFARGGDPQIVNNVISMLAATLATIVGFYFGGRTVQEATAAEKAKAPPSTVPSRSVTPSVKTPTPVLKVKGIKIGATKKIENGVVMQIQDVNIFGFWDTYGKNELEFKMDPIVEYSLYCNVESSIPESNYDIFIEPVLKKEFDSKPFLYDLRHPFEKMIPHPKQNTWYVKSFEWFPKYKNWREAGEYHVILKVGYLKKGTQLGTEPTWIGTEEFTVNLKNL